MEFVLPLNMISFEKIGIGISMYLLNTYDKNINLMIFKNKIIGKNSFYGKEKEDYNTFIICDKINKGRMVKKVLKLMYDKRIVTHKILCLNNDKNIENIYGVKIEVM